MTIKIADTFINVDEYLLTPDSGGLLDTLWISDPPSKQRILPAILTLGTTPPSFTARHTSSEFEFPPIGCIRGRNMNCVFPGILIDSTFKPVFSSKQFQWSTILNQFLLTPIAVRSREKCLGEIKDEVVCLVRPGDHIFGHWLIDILPRVWMTEKFSPNRVKYIVSESVPTFALELMRSLGVNHDRVIKWDGKAGYLNLHNVWNPSPLRYDQFSHPKLSNFAADLENRYQAYPTEKLNGAVFITRKAWNNDKKVVQRELLNSDKITNLLRERGCQIISQEQLSFADQIQLYRSAKIIIGEDGSALHMSIFGTQSLRLGNLRSDANGSLIQGGLCSIMGQRIGYVFGQAVDKITKGRNSGFCINESDIDALLIGLKSKLN